MDPDESTPNSTTTGPRRLDRAALVVALAPIAVVAVVAVRRGMTPPPPPDAGHQLIRTSPSKPPNLLSVLAGKGRTSPPGQSNWNWVSLQLPRETPPARRSALAGEDPASPPGRSDWPPQLVEAEAYLRQAAGEPAGFEVVDWDGPARNPSHDGIPGADETMVVTSREMDEHGGRASRVTLVGFSMGKVVGARTLGDSRPRAR